MRIASRLCLVAALLVTGACASSGGGRPPVPPGVPAEFLHFTDARTSVGEEAPAFTLERADDGAAVSLSDFRGRMLVLVFGSYT